MSNGLDFAYMYPGAAWIKQRFGFVMRYLSWPDAKVIDKAELDAYRAAGIDVGLNWEFRAQDQLGGAAAGREHAIEARRQAEALGAWPCVIFFSADWDVREWELPAVDAYLDAAAAVLGGPHLVGEYGGFLVVKHAMETGRAAYGWQTFAWSGGQWHPGALLRQVAVVNAAAAGYSPTGAEYDLNVSMAVDFGQVGGADDMAGWTDNNQQMLEHMHQTIQNGLLPLLGQIAELGAMKVELDATKTALDTVKATIDAAGGHPADAPILAAVAKAQASVDTIGAKLAKVGGALA